MPVINSADEMPMYSDRIIAKAKKEASMTNAGDVSGDSGDKTSEEALIHPVPYLPSFKDIMLLLDAVVESSTELESEIKNKISILLGDVTEEPISIEPQNGNFVVDSILYRLGVIDRHITSTMSQISRL